MVSLAPKKTSSQNGLCRIQSQTFGPWFTILISQQLSCYTPHQIQNHHSTKEIMVRKQNCKLTTDIERPFREWSQIWNTIIYYQTIFRSVLAIDEKHSSLWLHIFPGDGSSRRGHWLLPVMGGEFEKSRDICTRVSDLMINSCTRVDRIWYISFITQG